MLGCRSEAILPAFGESVTKQRGLRLFSSPNNAGETLLNSQVPFSLTFTVTCHPLKCVERRQYQRCD